MASFAPSSKNLSPSARPNPVPPPVMTITLSFNKSAWNINLSAPFSQMAIGLVCPIDREQSRNDSSKLDVAFDGGALEVPDGALIILVNLRLQGFDRFELLLAAQSMQEAHADLLAIDLAVEIHQVGLHRHVRVAPEGRPHTDVGDRPPPLAFDKGQRDIDPVGRQKTVVRLQVRRRVGELFPADLMPLDDAAFDAIWATEHPSCQVDAPVVQQPADRGRADAVAAQDQFRNLIGLAL